MIFSGGFGENANGGNSLVYSDIELYIMGLKSAKELRDANFRLDVYTGNSYEESGEFSFGKGYFYSTGVTSYTIDNLIALSGVREPDAAASQKNFKVLTVILSPAETPQHYADIVKSVSWFTGGMNDNSYPGWSVFNFAQATNGAGTMEAAGIKNSLKSPPAAIESLPAGSWRAAGLQVQPNPTTGMVYINNADGAEVKLYNLSGELLLLTTEDHIDLSSYPNGVYLLQAGDETVKVVKK
ncbi:T9SS type A sorting domain-containing protein [Candidatus Symbiothrix dinenymphae]|uniref:T9SS type A sorting domain-containing protein n=1 Tax=Candidatus Symbiothrix dinenymphae TaxID=467085 RepID=UPI0013159D03|nr:T9SS type A sorting domain-containing protein [Candidatus Symbiothrix dinenymphae]